MVNAVLRSDLWALPALGTGHRLGIQNAPAGGPLQITDHSTCVLTPLHCGVCPSMMYVRVSVCVGQTLLSYARGFPRGPKT